MRKLLLSLFSCFLSLISYSQTREADSLNHLLATTKEDTTKVMVLAKLSFYDPSFDRGLQLAQEGLTLAKKIGYKKGEAQCLHQIGNQYGAASNFPLALHYYLEGLKIREGIDDMQGLARSYNGIGSMYREQEDYSKALAFFLRGKEIFEKIKDVYYLALVHSNIGNTYIATNNPDSALMFLQKSYEYFNISRDKYQMAKALNGLGSVQLNMNNTELALGYYRMAIRNGTDYKDSTELAKSYYGISRLFKKINLPDSSILYAKQALSLAQLSKTQSIVIETSRLLSQLYQNTSEREALRYLTIALDAKDSTFSAEKNIQIQNMLYTEQDRQREVNEKLVKEKEQRRHNLQYAALALGLITFLIFFLLFSHSIMANQKLIRFLGVIALLIVFEFINLFIHPYLVKVTNDSPLLMLLVLVCIAALLVPAHHRLEKWITHRLSEKNKKIRLAAAKKTISELEGEQK